MTSPLSLYERRLQDVETNLRDMGRVSVVSDVKFDQDQKRWYVRVRDRPTSQGDGQSTNVDQDPNFYSSWLPWQSFSHGTITFSIPPRVGQSVVLNNNYGRPELGFVSPGFYNPSSPSPHDQTDQMAWEVHDPTDATSGASTSSSSTPLGQGGIGSDTAAAKHVRQVVSSDNKTTSTPGVTQKTDQSTVNESAQKTMTRTTGQSTLDSSTGAGGSPNLPHELNAQLQGIRAALTQHDHHIATMHDLVSKLNQIALPIIPQLATLQPFLQSDPAKLALAAQNILPKLEQYISQSFQQQVAKLTDGLLDNVMGIAQGEISGQLGGLIGQIANLASGAGLGAAAAPAIAAATSLISEAVGGSTANLSAAVGSLGMVFGGTPSIGLFTGLLGQLTGILGALGGLMSGLGGLTDAQQNLTKGMTKSYRLGGYSSGSSGTDSGSGSGSGSVTPSVANGTASQTVASAQTGLSNTDAVTPSVASGTASETVASHQTAGGGTTTTITYPTSTSTGPGGLLGHV